MACKQDYCKATFICINSGACYFSNLIILVYIQVTWDNPEELEDYIKKIQIAADKLTTENRRLRKSHFTVCDKVIY